MTRWVNRLPQRDKITTPFSRRRGLFLALVILIGAALYLLGSPHFYRYAVRQGNTYVRQLPDRAAADSYLIGAYYYPWYGPGRLKWQDGHPDQPALGEYDSADQNIVDQQIDLATGYGIDFFVVSWWGPGTSTDQTLQHSLLTSPLIHDIRFAIDYESDGRLIARHGAIDLNDPRNQQILASDVSYLENVFWNNPQYLTINGADVLFLYSSRAFVGDVAGVLQKLRQQAAKDGVRIYILGDEVYWDGTSGPPSGQLKPFDAVTSYNMYVPNLDILSGFDAKVAAEYSVWQQAANSLGITFVPDAVPGFDDAATRPGANHPPLPPSPELFRKQLDVALAHAEPPLNMVLITSWNEWNEDTAIEPSARFGRQYLEVLQQELQKASSSATGAVPARGQP